MNTGVLVPYDHGGSCPRVLPKRQPDMGIFNLELTSYSGTDGFATTDRSQLSPTVAYDRCDTTIVEQGLGIYNDGPRLPFVTS